MSRLLEESGHAVDEHPPPWTLRPALPEDVEAVAELRAVVMRPDLERLGRYDEHRVRQRLRDAYVPEHTTVVSVGGGFAGCVTLRPAADCWWLENFLLSPPSRATASAPPCCAGSWTVRTPSGCPYG